MRFRARDAEEEGRGEMLSLFEEKMRFRARDAEEEGREEMLSFSTFRK